MAIHTELLIKRLDALFESTGQPSPLLKTILTHFKDRTREVTEAVRGNLKAQAGKPSLKTETTPSGSRVLITVKLTGGTGSGDLRRQAEFLASAFRSGPLSKRLISPTMEKAGVKLTLKLEEGVGPGWGRVLDNEVGPLVSAELTEDGGLGDYQFQAALLFHHPEDTASRRARLAKDTEEPLPTGEERAFDGGVLMIQGHNLRLVDTAHGYVSREGNGFRNLQIRAEDKYDPAARSLIEAASSRSATYDGLATLARRLGMDTGPERLSWVVVKGPSEVHWRDAVALISALTQDVPRAALQFAVPEANLRLDRASGGWRADLPEGGYVSVGWSWDPLKNDKDCGSWAVLCRPPAAHPLQFVRKGADFLGSDRLDIMNPKELDAFVDKVKTSMIQDLETLLNHDWD